MAVPRTETNFPTGAFEAGPLTPPQIINHMESLFPTGEFGQLSTAEQDHTLNMEYARIEETLANPATAQADRARLQGWRFEIARAYLENNPLPTRTGVTADVHADLGNLATNGVAVRDRVQARQRIDEEKRREANKKAHDDVQKQRDIAETQAHVEHVRHLPGVLRNTLINAAAGAARRLGATAVEQRLRKFAVGEVPKPAAPRLPDFPPEIPPDRAHMLEHAMTAATEVAVAAGQNPTEALAIALQAFAPDTGTPGEPFIPAVAIAYGTTHRTELGRDIVLWQQQQMVTANNEHRYEIEQIVDGAEQVVQRQYALDPIAASLPQIALRTAGGGVQGQTELVAQIDRQTIADLQRIRTEREAARTARIPNPAGVEAADKEAEKIKQARRSLGLGVPVGERAVPAVHLPVLRGRTTDTEVQQEGEVRQRAAETAALEEDLRKRGVTLREEPVIGNQQVMLITDRLNEYEDILFDGDELRQDVKEVERLARASTVDGITVTRARALHQREQVGQRRHELARLDYTRMLALRQHMHDNLDAAGRLNSDVDVDVWRMANEVADEASMTLEEFTEFAAVLAEYAPDDFDHFNFRNVYEWDDIHRGWINSYWADLRRYSDNMHDLARERMQRAARTETAVPETRVMTEVRSNLQAERARLEHTAAGNAQAEQLHSLNDFEEEVLTSQYETLFQTTPGEGVTRTDLDAQMREVRKRMRALGIMVPDLAMTADDADTDQIRTERRERARGMAMTVPAELANQTLLAGARDRIDADTAERHIREVQAEFDTYARLPEETQAIAAQRITYAAQVAIALQIRAEVDNAYDNRVWGAEPNIMRIVTEGRNDFQLTDGEYLRVLDILLHDQMPAGNDLLNLRNLGVDHYTPQRALVLMHELADNRIRHAEPLAVNPNLSADALIWDQLTGVNAQNRAQLPAEVMQMEQLFYLEYLARIDLAIQQHPEIADRRVEVLARMRSLGIPIPDRDIIPNRGNRAGLVRGWAEYQAGRRQTEGFTFPEMRALEGEFETRIRQALATARTRGYPLETDDKNVIRINTLDELRREYRLTDDEIGRLNRFVASRLQLAAGQTPVDLLIDLETTTNPAGERTTDYALVAADLVDIAAFNGHIALNNGVPPELIDQVQAQVEEARTRLRAAEQRRAATEALTRAPVDVAAEERARLQRVEQELADQNIPANLEDAMQHWRDLQLQQMDLDPSAPDYEDQYIAAQAAIDAAYGEIIALQTQGQAVVVASRPAAPPAPATNELAYFSQINRALERLEENPGQRQFNVLAAGANPRQRAGAVLAEIRARNRNGNATQLYERATQLVRTQQGQDPNPANLLVYSDVLREVRGLLFPGQ